MVLPVDRNESNGQQGLQASDPTNTSDKVAYRGKLEEKVLSDKNREHGSPVGKGAYHEVADGQVEDEYERRIHAQLFPGANNEHNREIAFSFNKQILNTS